MRLDDDVNNDEAAPFRVERARQVAQEILDAARGESIESVISAACGLVFDHWQDEPPSVGRDGERVLKEDELLRFVTRKGAARMAAVISDLVPSGREEHHLVFEELLTLRTARLARAGLSYASSVPVATLMAALVGPGERLLDPACGFGGTLLAAAKRHPRQQVVGADINREAADFATKRLTLAGVDSQISSHNWLDTRPEPIWDAIVLEPPMGTKIAVAEANPASDSQSARMVDGDSLWLRTVSESLSVTGRAVVLLPDGVAFRGGSSARVRADLLDSGVVEAIIALPQGAVLNSGVATCLWILSGTADARKQRSVLLLNGRASAAEGGEAGLGDVSRLVEVSLAWLDHAAFPGTDEWFARAVAVDVLIAEGDASPQRHLALPPERAAPRPTAPGRLLTKLRLSSFKSIDKHTEVPLRPLTLIYGKNSSGKSSLIQSLLLLKQSVEGAAMVTSGPLVNLGSFAGLVHKHEERRAVGIGVSFASARDLDSPAALPDPRRLRSVDLTFESNSRGRDGVVSTVRSGFGEHLFTWDRTGLDPATYSVSIPVFLEMVGIAYETDSVYPPRKSSSGKQATRVRSDLRRAGIDRADFFASGLSPGPASPAMLSEVTHRTSGSSRSGLVESALRTTAALFEAVGDELRHLLERTVYLGPLRKAPERLNVRNAQGAALDIPFFLLDNTSERKEVSSRLQSLGVSYDLDAITVSDPEERNLFGDIAAIVLTDTRTGVRLSPADVGFGISQVLPIVTELSARTRSTILIEQPEIHLHPAMQADLADLMIESIDESGRANQVIAETHSENIMLRVQRRIREGRLDAKDVVVLYVDQDETGSALVRELRLDRDGDFQDNWPHGFFVERFDELFGDFE